MSKEFNVYEGWRRNYMGDQPALRGDEENLRTNPPVIPQQCGFLTPDGVEVQMSYDRALSLGLIDESEQRWSMSHERYLREQNQ